MSLEAREFEPSPIIEIFHDTMIARVCSYCRGNIEHTLEWKGKGYSVTHGICPEHFAIEMAKYKS